MSNLVQGPAWEQGEEQGRREGSADQRAGKHTPEKGERESAGAAAVRGSNMRLGGLETICALGLPL